MTSLRQVEANRRNAQRSTGPVTAAGKTRSRCNAIRHGLTAETVIGMLEDAGDYHAFEAGVIADYDAQSTVERELVLRLASLLWRLRRATAMETGLFAIQAEHLRRSRRNEEIRAANSIGLEPGVAMQPDRTDEPAYIALIHQSKNTRTWATPMAAHCFLELAASPNETLDRLSRYEASLWRQVGQVMFALDALDRRKPQERRRATRNASGSQAERIRFRNTAPTSWSVGRL
jgi:hypothetical protein